MINQEIVQKCDENKVRELIDNELVKLNIPDKCDEKKVIEIIDKNLGDKNATLPDRSYEASIKELEDRQVRKCNFLIFMAPECDSILKKDVDENNMEITQAVINECRIGATIEGRQVRRIGHKHANARNPRPILVTMNNVYDKHTLFQRFVDKVKKSDNNTVKNLRISHDLTRCQREEEAKLAKEAKRMSNEDAGKKVCSAGSILGPKNLGAQELISSATNVNKTFVNSCNKNILVNSHKLNCIYTNIDQLSNKFSELELLLYTDQPDIVLITEVKPKNSRYCPMVGEFVVKMDTACGKQMLNQLLVGDVSYITKKT